MRPYATRAQRNIVCSRRKSGCGSRPLKLDVSFHLVTVMPSVKKQVHSLRGIWRSDRTRTLAHWGFPPGTAARTKRLIRSPKFFGRLTWRITGSRIYHKFSKSTGFFPYRIIWRDYGRAILELQMGETIVMCDIHFDGADSFYMLSGKANCEFFRRVKANNRSRGP